MPNDDARFRLSASQQERLIQACRRYNVRRLALFGSAVTGGFDAVSSDLDFVVDLAPPVNMGPADQYFGLLEELESIFGRSVDLVEHQAIRNPHFLAAIANSEEPLYAA